MHHLQRIATDMLPKLPTKHKRVAVSKHTNAILEEREKAALNSDAEAFERLTKEFRKSKKADKTQMMLDALDKDFDLRDKWLGIRQLKTEYRPQPYYRKDEKGHRGEG